MLLIAMDGDLDAPDAESANYYPDSLIDEFCRDCGIHKWFRICKVTDDGIAQDPLAYTVNQMVARREELNGQPFEIETDEVRTPLNATSTYSTTSNKCNVAL